MKKFNSLILFVLLLIGCTAGHALAQDANVRVRGVGVDIWNVNGETPSPNQMIYPIGIPRKWEARSSYSTLGERHFWTERPDRIANKDYATTARAQDDPRASSIDAISADRATTLLIAVPLSDMDVAGWTRVPGAFKTSIQTLYTYTYDYTTPNEWIDVPYFDENVPTIVFGERGKLAFDNPLPLSDLAEGVLIEDKMLPYNRKNPSTGSFYSFDPHFTILSNGDYVAGRNGARFLSKDKGATWSRLGSYNANHASTFEHNGDLYIIGDEAGLSNLESVITRSTDGGETWSTPVKLGFDGRNAPSSVEVSRGRIWLAMEDARNAVVKIASASVNSNLLDARSWTLTERPDNPRGDTGDDSEPCMAIGRDGYPIAFSILEGPVRASSATEATELFPSDEFQLPSRGSKFDVRYDAVTDEYWALTNYTPIEGNIRTGMTLFSSTDLKSWKQERVVIQASSVNFHGFQYPSMQFDGDDLVFVSRTAYENKYGQAQRWHDSNMLTFHRVENFRGNTPPATCSLVPYLNVDDGGWNRVGTANVSAGDKVWFGPQSQRFGADQSEGWSWTGPNGFTSSGRSLVIESIQADQAGVYTVTNTDPSGCETSFEFTLTVDGDGGETSLVGSYYLRNVATGRYLDANPDGEVVQGSSRGGEDTQWKLTESTPGYYFVDNAMTDRGPLSAKPSPNNAITYLAERYNNSAYQNREWEATQVSGDVYQFRCKDNARGYLTASGTREVVNGSDENSEAAQWELVRAGSSSRTADAGSQVMLRGSEALVYPNPVSSETFTLSLDNVQASEVSVYDATGRRVYHQRLAPEQTPSSLTIETPSQAGLYYITTTSLLGSPRTVKFIVE